MKIQVVWALFLSVGALGALECDYKGGRRKFFVIVCSQRTGSDFLRKLLRAHPCIACDGEVFYDPGRWSVVQQQHLLRSVYEEKPELRANLTSFLERRTVGNDERYAATSVWGFKWMLNQHFEPWFYALAAAHDVRVIWLKRRNVLNQLISSAVNRAYVGPAHPTEGDVETMRAVRIKLDTHDLVHKLARYETDNRHQEELLDAYRKDWGLNATAVHYEDLSVNTEAVVDRLYSFILDPATVAANRHKNEKTKPKILTGHSASYISNWPDVDATLRPTRFAYYLDDPATVAQPWQLEDDDGGDETPPHSSAL